MYNSKDRIYESLKISEARGGKMEQRLKIVGRKPRKKQSKLARIINQLISCTLVGVFSYALYSADFFQLFYLNQVRLFNNEETQSTTLDLTVPQDVMNLMMNLQEHLMMLLVSEEVEEMYTLLNDGFAFSGEYDPTQTKLEETTQPIEENEEISEPLSKPLVYLMNTHTTETFEDNKIDAALGRPFNVQDLSYMMAEYFNNHGIQTIVENRDVGDLVREKQWAYYRSYEASRIFLEEVADQHETLNFFFDIHRDSLQHQWTTIEINEKSFAQIVMIIGADHENYHQNYEIAQHVHQLLEENYPGLSKGVMKKSGVGVDGIYNQDFSEALLLFEIGGVDNTQEELRNTVQVLTNSLAELINNR